MFKQTALVYNPIFTLIYGLVQVTFMKNPNNYIFNDGVDPFANGNNRTRKTVSFT